MWTRTEALRTAGIFVPRFARLACACGESFCVEMMCE